MGIRKLTVSGLMLGALVLSGGPKLAAADAEAERLLQRGMALYDANNYAAALPVLLEAARRGHPRAEALLGIMYQEGQGVAADDRVAAAWFARAAAQGHRAAQYALGGMYEEGEGVPRDLQKAAQLYEASARQGFPEAQLAVGMCYEFGTGVERNRSSALYWFRKAARRENGKYGWLAAIYADWLSRPGTPQFRNDIELVNWINAQVAPKSAPLSEDQSWRLAARTAAIHRYLNSHPGASESEARTYAP